MVQQVYKVRNSTTGLFAKKMRDSHSFGGFEWSETGSIWTKPSHIKVALKTGSLKKAKKDKLTIVAFELKRLPGLDLKVSKL